ncbi:DNA replication and repair protein RecO [Amphibacillus marinus]|uniref:DNA repair protein RecO n=1 Tax=Amphibacillus marinus TaxID=872970 RepID=A0A1H8HIY8_9BACI|nr:DNA repair protein RecO [Amphibacillus marinus]SEN56153.1 DNA replication and repair protein RecO [Amphibacillus marinus]
MFERIEGVIIRTQDYGETHKIVTLFTKQLGKLALIARGSKKPKSRMASITQMFIQGEYLVQLGRGLAVMQQGEVINSHRKIREDIVQTAYASYIAELTDKLMEEKKPNHLVYQQFVAALSGIVDQKDAAILALIYELKLYKVAGFAPILSQCTSCQRQDQLVGFSLSEAGLVCRFCAHKDSNAMLLNSTQIKLIQLFDQTDLTRIANISVKEENKQVILRLLVAYYDQYGGLTIKSKRFLDQLDSLL